MLGQTLYKYDFLARSTDRRQRRAGTLPTADDDEVCRRRCNTSS